MHTLEVSPNVSLSSENLPKHPITTTDTLELVTDNYSFGDDDSIKCQRQNIELVSVEVEEAFVKKKTSNFLKFVYILLSFVFSISMNIYNTFLFNKQRYNLGLPLLAASLYDWTQLCMAGFIMMLMEWNSGPGVIGSFKLLSRRQFYRIILPCGIAAALNVGLSNSSLKYVSLSFYTMVKSCSPVFVLLFAFLFGLERPTPILLSTMVLIGFGIVLTVWDSVSFSFIGFILVFSATILSGLRWALTQLIIEHTDLDDIDENKALTSPSPLRTLIYLAPIVGSILLVLSLVFEGPTTILESSFFSSFESAMRSFIICIVGGVQTFCLILLEYKVVQETSVLTFAITGIIKEILLICLSVMVFGDKLKFINICGVALSIFGILIYNIYRSQVAEQSSFDLEERKRRRAAGDAMKNMFVALPTSEPSWMIEPFNASDKSLNTSLFWPFTPNASPIINRHEPHRRSSSWREFRKSFDSISLKSNKTMSPKYMVNEDGMQNQRDAVEAQLP